MVTGFFIGLILLIVIAASSDAQITFSDFVMMCGGGAAIGWLLQFEFIRWIIAAFLVLLVPTVLWAWLSIWWEERSAKLSLWWEERSAKKKGDE